MSSSHPHLSLPSSPVEEDIGHVDTLTHDYDHDHDHDQSGHDQNGDSTPAGRTSVFLAANNKHKERAWREASYEEGSDENDVLEPAETPPDEYPPSKEDEAETRRVEETLRRWEISERQRRKSARESAASTSGTSSLVGDVARKTSLLWSGRNERKRSSTIRGVGAHRVLSTTDDAVPLTDLENVPTVASPSSTPENPFKSPAASTTSLNDQYNSAIMTASTDPPSPFADPEDDLCTPTTSTALRPPLENRAFSSSSSSSKRDFPAPQPLNLPRPRSPPPRTVTPHANRPPEPFAPPVVAVRQAEEPEEDDKPKQWWVDWLCGCSVGPDRGGEEQAGRTNPFE